MFLSSIEPDKATISLAERPLFWNLVMRLLRVAVGGGITPLLAADRLAVLESLLPSFTFQFGPPSCKNRKDVKIELCAWS